MCFDRTSSRVPVAREKRPQRRRQRYILVLLRFAVARLSPGPFPGSASHAITFAAHVRRPFSVLKLPLVFVTVSPPFRYNLADHLPFPSFRVAMTFFVPQVISIWLIILFLAGCLCCVRLREVLHTSLDSSTCIRTVWKDFTKCIT